MWLNPSECFLFLLTFGVIAGVDVGFGTVGPVQTTMTQWFDQKRTRAMAITRTASAFGGFIAAPLLTKVLSSTGKWNIFWLVVAGVALIALLIDLSLVKNQHSDIEQIPDGKIVTADTQENVNHKTTTFNPFNTEENGP